MKFNKILIAAILFTSALSAQNYNVEVSYVTLKKGEASPIKKHETKIDPNIKVHQNDFIVLVPEVEFQTIEGIGGAFNENGGEALFSLPKTKQREVLKNLFNTNNANLVFNRTPIGASDFSLDAYSYSMVPEDYDMKYFSIKRDKKHLLPFIKEALKENNSMILQASPWSPPAWMKYSNAMDKNNLDKEKSRLIESPEIYEAYTTYLIKYIKAYKNEGVEIDRFCIQNEPDTYAPFPGCNMTMEQLQDLSVNYVIPAFKNEDLDTGIWAGTFRTINRGDHYKLLNSKTFENFDGIGFQYANEAFIREVSLLAPNMKIMNTETKCYNGDNSTEQAKERLSEIANYINAGSTNYCYWNLILNETSNSAWGWKQNSLMVINRQNGAIQYTPDYNAMYLASNSVVKGDKRIAHISKHRIVTTKNRNNEIKVLIQNNKSTNQFVRLIIGEEEINVELPEDALCSLTLKLNN
ncbi:glycoside hydrolase family 30 protein [Algibacter agarivorans]|uniref:Glycoside hydrolase family 30 protein n=1 Tax=Algibacter agarivorans TaxID=1109741 RepID=A0ABP9GAD2_9FLAO